MKEVRKNVYRPGSYVYVEGDEDVDEVFVVETGLIEFTSSSNRVRTRGTTAGPGDVFGFISSLSRRPRMESAYAKTASTVLVFTRDRFLAMLQKNAAIALKLLDSFADELRLYDTMIFPLEGSREDLLTPEERLYNLGTYYWREGQGSTAAYILARYLDLYPGGRFENEARSILAELGKKGLSGKPAFIREGIYRRYPDRQVIFCEYEPGNELFVIKSGRVKIVKRHAEREVILSVLKEGDIFGELAIISDEPRNATAISFGGVTVLPIDKEALLKLIAKSSDLLKRIFTALSQRVWFTFIRMEAKLYEKPITRVYAFLENKLVEESVSLKSREPHTFTFGIGELLKMAGVTDHHAAEVTEELMRDRNISFLEGQTVIGNPSHVSSKARYYRARDRLYESNEGAGEEHDRGPARPAEPEREIRRATPPEPSVKAEPTEGVAAGDAFFDELEEELRDKE